MVRTRTPPSASFLFHAFDRAMAFCDNYGNVNGSSCGVIDDVFIESTSTSGSSDTETPLSEDVIAGLAGAAGFNLLALLFLAYAWFRRRRARKAGPLASSKSGGVAISWSDVSYFVPGSGNYSWSSLVSPLKNRRARRDLNDHRIVLDNVSGVVSPGEMMAIMGPSGAGKTTLIEILAGKDKSGHVTGSVSFSSATPRSESSSPVAPRIGFVPQQDILPPMLTVHEVILFAARLRLPENIPDSDKTARVDAVLSQLEISHVRDIRIGDGEKRGISGGEMRRVSIGLELIARPDVLILDEPMSGLDSVSAKKVAEVLSALAHDAENPTAVIASIHQPSHQLFQTFDKILLLSHGRALYSGPGGLIPSEYFSARGIPYIAGYNIADYLLDVAGDPPIGLFQTSRNDQASSSENAKELSSYEVLVLGGGDEAQKGVGSSWRSRYFGQKYAAMFLTQLEVLSGREWKVLKRDKALFLMHVGVACILSVFVGGMYYKAGITIAGFQSRVGCLFFLGALVAFSTLSALYNIIKVRPLFLRERSASYYSPNAWIMSRFMYDVMPLRVVPTVIVSTVAYWMVGFSPDAVHFFKFLFILFMYTFVMTLLNFVLACIFRNGVIAILLSALLALYQMTYAGFFLHVDTIPPVLRWLQWLCPLRYNLEALSVNEAGSGLIIKDSLEGVPVDIPASLLVEDLFGFGENNYRRDVLVLIAFMAGFSVMMFGAVWIKVRERR